MTAEPPQNVYKLGPSIPVSVSRLREGCTWCGESLEHAEEFTLVGFVDYAHGPLPNDCPSDPGPTSDRCRHCDGTGHLDVEETVACPTCGGNGEAQRENPS